jgi:predicted Zn-dependent protease with MMP-like domain
MPVGMSSPSRTYAPDAAALERLADQAVARLPEQFRAFLDGVVVRVVEEAEDDVLAGLGLESPYDLTGLYTGRSLREESSWASGELRPMIHLYRRALLLEWVETEVALEALITHVIVHEVGHHFGLSDEDMHALEEQA